MKSQIVVSLASAPLMLVPCGQATPALAEPPGTASPPGQTLAAPTPGPVVTLAATTYGQEVVVDRHGVATAVWAKTWRGPVMASRRSAGGTWSKAVVIGRGSLPQAGVDAAGTVTVVFQTNRKGWTRGLSAVRRPAGGRWSTPVRLSKDKVDKHSEDLGVDQVDLAVAPTGHVVVAWQWGSEEDSVPYRIEVDRRPAAGAWTGLVRLTTKDGSHRPRVGVDDAGRATLIYGHASALAARRFVPGSGWTGPRTLPGTRQVTDHDVVVAPGGDSTLVLGRYRSGQSQVVATSRPWDGPWEALQRLSPDAEWTDPIGVTVDDAGAVTAGWESPTGIAVVRRVAGAWGAPFTVTGPGIDLEKGLAAEPGGAVLVWWSNDRLGVRGRLRSGTGDWTDRFTMWPRPAGASLGGPGAALGPTAVISWILRNGTFRVRPVTLG